MTPELGVALGRAVTYVAGRGKAHAPRVLIGKDTRLSGYMLETAIASGVCSMGGRVILCGPLPTPAVAHLTTSMRADAGVVISASHNPYADNGIKIFGGDGFKLPDEAEAEIETLMADESLMGPQADGAGHRQGRAPDRRARSLRGLREADVPARALARRRPHRHRRGPRRGVQGRAAGVRRARRAADVPRHQAERPQHQQGLPAPSTRRTRARRS